MRLRQWVLVLAFALCVVMMFVFGLARQDDPEPLVVSPDKDVIGVRVLPLLGAVDERGAWE